MYRNHVIEPTENITAEMAEAHLVAANQLQAAMQAMMKCSPKVDQFDKEETYLEAYRQHYNRITEIGNLYSVFDCAAENLRNYLS